MHGNSRVQEAHYQSFDQIAVYSCPSPWWRTSSDHVSSLLDGHLWGQALIETLVSLCGELWGASCNGREGDPYGGAVSYDPAGPLLVCSCRKEILNVISRDGPTRRPARPIITIIGLKLQQTVPRYRLQSSYMVASQVRCGNNSLIPCRAMAAEEHCGRN